MCDNMFKVMLYLGCRVRVKVSLAFAI